MQRTYFELTFYAIPRHIPHCYLGRMWVIPPNRPSRVFDHSLGHYKETLNSQNDLGKLGKFKTMHPSVFCVLFLSTKLRDFTLYLRTFAIMTIATSRKMSLEINFSAIVTVLCSYPIFSHPTVAQCYENTTSKYNFTVG